MNRVLLSRSPGPIIGLAALLAMSSSCAKGEGGVSLPADPPPASSSAPPEAAVAERAPGQASSPEAPQRGRRVTVNGTTEAHRMSTLRAKAPGLIDKVHVLDGQAVSAGELLVSLDTSDLELHLAAARAALRFAQAQQKAARIEARRATKLVADRALPKAQQERASSQLEIATAGVGQARVAVQMASKAIADATIVAPYDSVVVKRHVAQGDYASAMPPQPLVTLQEIDPIDLRLIVPAVHQGAFRAGGHVTIRFPHSGLEREGVIDRVVPAMDPRNRALSAVVVLDNHDGALLPGMFAEISLAPAASPPKSPASAEGAR